MKSSVSRFLAHMGILAISGSVVVLSGCSANFGDVSNTTTATAMHIQGVVHGGQQALNGAHVYMYAASTAGYGGVRTAASAANASTSLLTAATGVTTSDGTNFYVTTDQAGDFNIDGAFACTPGTEVYLYSTGGDPQLNGFGTSSGNNTAAGLLAVLGPCASATPSAAFPNVTFVTMNEVSTIAAAYALAGFTTDATHIGAPSAVTGHTLSGTGITNAFNTALNIVDQATGLPVATTKATGSVGTVPVTLINTLADILAVCVNSTGPTSSGCSTLFSNSPSGTVDPTDTARAAINIAQNPIQDVSALLKTVQSVPPFSPTAVSPVDLTLAVTYSGLNVPYGIAVDGLGNLFVPNAGTTGANVNSVTKLSPLGVPTNYTGGNFNSPQNVTIDTSNTAWIVNANPVGGTYYLSSISGSGAVTSYTLGGALQSPVFDDVGGDGSIWIANTHAANVIRFVPPSTVTVITGVGARPSGIAAYFDASAGTFNQAVVSYEPDATLGTLLTQIVGVTPTAASASVNADLASPWGVAIAQGLGIWPANAIAGAGSIVGIENGAQTVAFNVTGSTFDDPQFIVFDGGNNPWASNAQGNTVTYDFRAGGGNTPVNYAAGGTLKNPEGIAIDGSGNVWVANQTGNTVSEMIGAAVPVVTPLQASLLAPYTTPAAQP